MSPRVPCAHQAPVVRLAHGEQVLGRSWRFSSAHTFDGMGMQFFHFILGHISKCLKTLLEVPRLVAVRCQSHSACVQNLADALFHSPQTFQAVSKLLYFWSVSTQGLAKPCVHALGLDKEFGH